MLSTPRGAPVQSPAPMMFFVVENNGGGYHWTIVAGGGETLVRSASFATYKEARRAADMVHDGASSASFADLAGGTPPVELSASRNGATARDALDDERWLDEGGSFSSEAVTR